MSVRAASLVIAVLAIAAGCEVRPELGAACARASECSRPLVCAIGRCRNECGDSRDCPTLARCLIEPSSGLGVCSLDRVDSCATHACAIGFVCQDDACLNACDAIASCPDGVCRSGVCLPVRGDAGMLPDAAIEHDGGDASVGPSRTLTATIAADADDGEIEGFSLHAIGEAGDGIIYVGYWNPTGPTRGFLRFTLPEAIPAGATILDAHVDLVATETAGLSLGTDYLVVVAANSADAPQPVDAESYPGGTSSPPPTSASVRWGSLMTWPVGPTSSPDLSPIIDELVLTHGGLTAGAHVALYAWGDGFTHDSECSWSDSSRVDQDPTLVVTFTP